jgi:formylglycine-generating enzyme required for sulfatase activity
MRRNTLLKVQRLRLVGLAVFLLGNTTQHVSGQGAGRPKTPPVQKGTPSEPINRNSRGSFRPQNPNIELVRIPSGSFIMGSISDKSDEQPVHQVTIKYSFYMGKHEIT